MRFCLFRRLIDSLRKMFKRIKYLRDNERFSVFVLFIWAFGLRLALLLNTDNGIDSEAPGRIFQSMHWLSAMNFMPGEFNYGPLDFCFIAGALSLWNNVFWSPRLVSLLFGSLTIVPFFYFLKYCFSRETAFLGGALLSVFILHVKHSVITTAMASFGFFLCLALFFYVYFLEVNNCLFFILLSAVSLNLANMLRFEGWVFIPVFSVFLFLKGKRPAAALFLLVSLILPVCFIALSGCSVLEPFGFLKVAGDQALMTIKKDLARRVFLLPNSLLAILAAPAFIAAFTGISYHLYKRKYTIALFAFFSLFAVFFWMGIRGLMDFQIARYSLTLGLLLIPFSIEGARLMINLLVKASGKIYEWFCRLGAMRFEKFPSVVRALLWIIFFAAAVFTQFGRMNNELSELKVQEYVKSAGVWLKENIKDDKIIILDYDWSWNQNIILYSELPLEQFGWTEAKPYYRYIPNEGMKVNKEKVLGDLVSGRAKYIVVFWGEEQQEGGLFRFFFGLAQDIAEKKIFGLTLKRRYQDQDYYAVYEVLP